LSGNRTVENGQTFSREVQHAKGSPEVPMTADEIKPFTDCARETLAKVRRSASRLLDQLETLKDIRPLYQLLIG
jgi:hypothetical protein